MSPLLAAVLVLLAVVAAWQLLARRHDTLAELDGRVPGEEAEAVRRLFDAAGVAPHEVLLVESEDPEAPCWHPRWGWLDRLLGSSRRFGPFSSGLRCVGVYDGRVVGVSLVGAPLSDAGPLTWLHDLRTLRLHSAGLDALATLPRPCRLVHLDLAENQLEDLDGLPPCPDLYRLDVPRNRLRRLPPLDRLPALERLDASANRLTDATPLAGHPALEWAFLGANDLASPEGLAGLPRLRYLGLGSNPLTTLDGLDALPLLRSLRLNDTALTALPAGFLDRFPALEHVTLERSPIQRLPDGYVYDESGLREVTVRPPGGGPPELDVTGTPVGERLRTGALEAHDGTAAHPADRLPRGSGRIQGSTRRVRTRTGLGSGLEAQGAMDWMTGAQSLAFDLDRGVPVTVEASVEAGRLRVYLRDGEGYRYAEAVPGAPLRLSGRLITGTDGYFFYVEAVEGRAEGVAWSVSG